MAARDAAATSIGQHQRLNSPCPPYLGSDVQAGVITVRHLAPLTVHGEIRMNILTKAYIF
ncbi:hypothetical protein BDA96_03G239700 [Sorghum bicolor]|uniref:Uncharacterized protein n=2 Tax=Sorghum bicolor TaxID=4558 RepID=A0A921UQW7_SORBI|nr:hypothetical protein BDA96_03G239700 [Sorghum bicolor]OQU87175.1 hypothetical protein SORBI_3003G221450 [Sorghum bicolor]